MKIIEDLCLEIPSIIKDKLDFDLFLDFGQKEKIVSVIITLTKSGNVPLSPVNLITEK